MVTLGVLIIVAGLLARLSIRYIGLRRAQPYYRWNTGVWETVCKHYRRRGAYIATACTIVGLLLVIEGKMAI